MTAIPEQAQSSSITSSSSNKLDRIKLECSAMMRLLKNLEKEEKLLQTQNEILAREALLCGFEPHLLEPPAPKRRKNVLQKQSLQSSNSDAAAADGGSAD
ncbi:hypothetical protein MPSEU_000285200 [Mayamaea pseudoterrestris]|nr:hypothetical protein MPSEU_000285200 [Mayamaea pseudoterrestris]